MRILLLIIFTSYSIFAEDECIPPKIKIYRKLTSSSKLEASCEEIPKTTSIPKSGRFLVCIGPADSFKCSQKPLDKIEEEIQKWKAPVAEPTITPDTSSTQQTSHQHGQECYPNKHLEGLTMLNNVILKIAALPQESLSYLKSIQKTTWIITAAVIILSPIVYGIIDAIRINNKRHRALT